MSNPGGRFEATDVGPSDAPRRRLIFGGVSDRYCLVHYEYGGIAHGYTTVLFAISGNQATALWAHAGGRYSDLKEFAKETNRDELSNEVNGIIFWYFVVHFHKAQHIPRAKSWFVALPDKWI
jgi:hypothetical protein